MGDSADDLEEVASEDKTLAGDYENSIADDEKSEGKDLDDSDSYKISNQYFPTNCGMTFCLDEIPADIDITVSGALYRLAEPEDVSVYFTENEKNLLLGKIGEDERRG